MSFNWDDSYHVGYRVFWSTDSFEKFKMQSDHHKPPVNSASVFWTKVSFNLLKTKEGKEFSISVGGKRLKCHYILQKPFTAFCFYKL